MPVEKELSEAINALRKLNGPGQVLSLYLPLDATPALEHGHVALAKNTLRAMEASVGGNDHEESQVVLSYVESVVPHGRTLVVFSSTEMDLFEVLQLQVPLPAVARLAPRPYLAPLESALDDYPRIAVVALDERDARFMVTDLTEILVQEKIHDDVPGRQRQGGWAAFRFERDRAEHVRSHLRHAAESLNDLYQREPFKRIVVCGSAETAPAFIEELTTELQHLVVGTISVGMYQSDHEMVAAALAVAEAVERSEEVELIKQINDLAFAGGKASLGWDETSQMLREGRVHRLAISENQLASATGAEAVQLAWDSGSEVEFLHGEAEEMLADNGGIGAILRY